MRAGSPEGSMAVMWESIVQGNGDQAVAKAPGKNSAANIWLSPVPVSSSALLTSSRAVSMRLARSMPPLAPAQPVGRPVLRLSSRTGTHPPRHRLGLPRRHRTSASFAVQFGAHGILVLYLASGRDEIEGICISAPEEAYEEVPAAGGGNLEPPTSTAAVWVTGTLLPAPKELFA